MHAKGGVWPGVPSDSWRTLLYEVNEAELNKGLEKVESLTPQKMDPRLPADAP